MVQEFFTVAEIAGLLKLSQRMIRNSIKAKKLKAVRFGRAVRVPADSLSRWMTEEDR
jgi:excisionase family DNA binding protein